MMGAFFFAALTRVDVPGTGQPLGKTPGFIFKDGLLILILALSLMLVLVIWAKYFRNWKPKKRRWQGQKVYREGDDLSVEEDERESKEAEEEQPGGVRRKYKYRYKRRGHRNRNPTLAETGGLPPSRPDESTRSS
jgi:hypothetical protein